MLMKDMRKIIISMVMRSLWDEVRREKIYMMSILIDEWRDGKMIISSNLSVVVHLTFVVLFYYFCMHMISMYLTLPLFIHNFIMYTIFSRVIYTCILHYQLMFYMQRSSILCVCLMYFYFSLFIYVWKSSTIIVFVLAYRTFLPFYLRVSIIDFWTTINIY